METGTKKVRRPEGKETSEVEDEDEEWTKGRKDGRRRPAQIGEAKVDSRGGRRDLGTRLGGTGLMEFLGGAEDWEAGEKTRNM
jgi:hypothetical protein